jgi:hypothetical protein
MRQEVSVFADNDPSGRDRIFPDLPVGSTFESDVSHVLTIETLCREKPRESGRQLLINQKFHADRTTG